MARAKRYWLMKSEPNVYSIADLQRDGRTYWDGVRNYQARNFMRDDMQVGDEIFFFIARARRMGIIGGENWVREPNQAQPLLAPPSNPPMRKTVTPIPR